MRRAIVLAVAVGLLAGCTMVGSKIGHHDSERSGKGAAVMATMSAARTLSVSIGRTPAEVYAFVSNPENLPQWAKGLGQSIQKEGEGWIVATPQGPVRFRFAARNEFGVLDHYVTLPSGVEVYVPMRVVANGSGSEVLFTLFRAPGMTDAQYAADAQMVEADLRALQALFER